MKHNKKTLALAICSVLALSACNSSSSSAPSPTPDPTPVTPSDLVIGLGLQVNYESCNSRLLLEQRVDRVYNVSLSKTNPTYVFTGRGNPESLKRCFENGEGLTEAQAMKDIIVNKYNVDPSKVILEETSISTEENGLYLKPILDDMVANGDLVINSMSLVSSAYHNHRQAYRTGEDNSSVYYFNDTFGADTFKDGVNVYDASNLAEETVWSESETLVSGGDFNASNSTKIVGDVNGSGFKDVVLVDHKSGDIYVANSNGAVNTFAKPVKVLTTELLTGNITLADVTGDKNLDIVGTTALGVFVASGKGDGTFNSATEFTSDFNSSNNLLFTDINKDGKADLVNFSTDGVYVIKGNGIDFSDTANKVLSDFGSEQFADKNKTFKYGDKGSDYPRFIGDVNGNGYGDLVAFAHDAVYVALNNKNGGFDAATTWLSNDIEGNGLAFVKSVNTAELVSTGWAADSYWGAEHPRGVADINGNGRADLWAIGEHGVYVAWSADINRDGKGDHFENLNSVWVYESKWRHNSENDGAFKQFTAYRGWDTERDTRLFSDMNNNGRSDLVGFGKDKVFVSISLNP